MTVTFLNTRRKKILQTIVEAYIESAQPIGSGAIVQRLRVPISSATVRNVMAELDELGLIWQPHTSAGRIPTHKGYRYYIDSLLEVEQLSSAEKELIERRYPAQDEAFDELLKEVLRLLSNFSGYTALAFATGLRKILFKKLEFVPVQSTKLLVVMESQEGLVKTAVIQMPYQVEQQELAKITKYLNEEFTGLALDEIKKRISVQLLTTQDIFLHLLKKAQQILDLTFNSFTKDRLYLEGTSCILTQPEFRDSHKLQAILKTFEQEEFLLKEMKEDLDKDGVRVYIGSENHCTNIQECSLVISNLKIKNRNLGALGIIGPCRMSYSKAMAAVEYIARMFSERIVNVES